MKKNYIIIFLIILVSGFIHNSALISYKNSNLSERITQEVERMKNEMNIELKRDCKKFMGEITQLNESISVIDREQYEHGKYFFSKLKLKLEIEMEIHHLILYITGSKNKSEFECVGLIK
ncbi:MAG: hypothetical protein ACI9QD_000297 [Thermoproteota archaeon]|jgi:hypothetical protein